MNHRQTLRIAEHEAAYAIVAQKMGLPVAWVQITPGFEEGIDFMAAVKIPDELIDRERDLLAICVAMSAPSHLPHRGTEIGRYAEIEAGLAYEVAGRAGIEFDEVFDLAELHVTENRADIVDLALTLIEKGRVEFATA